jgi:membrane associated rhomboid family serine protease
VETRGPNEGMSGRDVVTVLVVLMVTGVLVWSVTAWVYTSATTRVSGTLVGLMMGGLLLWVLAWRLEARGQRERPRP